MYYLNFLLYDSRMVRILQYIYYALAVGTRYILLLSVLTYKKSKKKDFTYSLELEQKFHISYKTKLSLKYELNMCLGGV